MIIVHISKTLTVVLIRSAVALDNIVHIYAILCYCCCFCMYFTVYTQWCIFAWIKLKIKFWEVETKSLLILVVWHYRFMVL